MKFQQGKVVVIEIVCYIQIRKKQGGVPGIFRVEKHAFFVR